MYLVAKQPGKDRTGAISKFSLKKCGTYFQKRPNLLAFLFFLVISCVQLWPLPANLSNTLFDLGDPADSTYRLGTIAYNLTNNPFNLYQTNAFYPVSNALALDELLTGNGLLIAPVIWLTNNPVLGFNLLVLASYILSGFAMWLVVVRLTGSKAAGLVSGVIYAYSPWHMSHYAHLGIAAQQWMIFALFFLMLFLDAPRLRGRGLGWLGLFGLFYALQILVAGYHAYTGAILFTIYLFYHFGIKEKIVGWLGSGVKGLTLKLLKRSRPADPLIRSPNWKKIGTQVGLLTFAGLVVITVILPFVLPFIENQKAFGFQRGIEETRYWSAAPSSLLRTNPQSWQYRPIQRGIFQAQTSAERALYPGLSVLLLAGLGLVFGRKSNSQSPGLRWSFAFVGLVGLVLALGPSLNLEEYGQSPTDIALPYRWLYNNLPGFDSLRVPLRFGHLLMLGLAVCAGYGVVWLQRAKLPWKKSSAPVWFTPLLVGSCCVGLVYADFFTPGWPSLGAPSVVGLNENAPALYRWLANDPLAGNLVPRDALLIMLPLPTKNPINTRPDFLIYGLYHQRPMLNGSANIIPPGYPFLLNELANFPDERGLDVLEGLKVRFIIINRPSLSDPAKVALSKVLSQGTRLEQVYDGGEDVLVRVKPGNRFSPAAKLIKPGSNILLAEEKKYKSLYLLAAAGLLGPEYSYFAPTQTVYSRLLNIQGSSPNYKYDCLLAYSRTNPTDYGFTPTNLVWENEVVRLYRKDEEQT